MLERLIKLFIIRETGDTVRRLVTLCFSGIFWWESFVQWQDENAPAYLTWILIACAILLQGIAFQKAPNQNVE